MGVFQRKRQRERQRTHKFGFERSSKRGNFGVLQYILIIFAVAVFATIATIAKIELKSISAIVVAAIDGEWFPIATISLNFFFQRSQQS